MPIVSPPRFVGLDAVGALFGMSAQRVRKNLARGHPLLTAGYLGKVSNRHTWNLSELLASTFTDQASIDTIVDRLYSTAQPSLLCEVRDCDRQAEPLGLCRVHLRHLFTAWRHAETSSIVTLQFVAMCQWVVERNAHLILPPGYDPWAPICMTPGCGEPTNIQGPDAWHGPLCVKCSLKFWRNTPDRPHPEWWKRTA